jgi:hypothetical protein
MTNYKIFKPKNMKNIKPFVLMLAGICSVSLLQAQEEVKAEITKPVQSTTPMPGSSALAASMPQPLVPQPGTTVEKAKPAETATSVSIKNDIEAPPQGKLQVLPSAEIKMKLTAEQQKTAEGKTTKPAHLTQQPLPVDPSAIGTPKVAPVN